MIVTCEVCGGLTSDKCEEPIAGAPCTCPFPTVKSPYPELKKAYTEGIAEGRRLEREEMRCSTCQHFRNDDELDHAGDCTSNKQMEASMVSAHFGCIHHERRKE